MIEKAFLQVQHQLKGFINAKVKNDPDAEDILQDVFIKISAKSHQLQDSEKFNHWVYKITRNSIMDYYRNRKRVIETELADTEENYNLFNDCVAHCLNDILKTLPSPYREALEKVELENHPQKDIAKELGISYTGFKSRVQRARLLLKEKMQQQYHIQTDGYGNVIVCEDKLPCGCDPIL
jgi:RNA polymerase sigma-70 factor (ECF subfamily)